MVYTIEILRQNQIPILVPRVRGPGVEREPLSALAAGREKERITVTVKFAKPDQAVVDLVLTFRLNTGETMVYHHKLDATWSGPAVAERVQVELLDGERSESFDG